VADRLMLGERSSRDGGRDVLESATTRRLERLMYDWRRHFDVVNLYWGPDDRAGHLVEILRQSRPHLVVALGNQVAKALGVPAELNWFARWMVPQWLVKDWMPHEPLRRLVVVKFPHPSGRSRLWNDPMFCAEASWALQAVVQEPLP